ncbi:MAG TPA: glycosyltransferase family A protein [Wenzhouxiangella sp.]|nr:glycosyltransferase family A protein [Wenzhouxiangella sp.]
MPEVAAHRKPPRVDAVVIGRNEGERLQACLLSLKGQVQRVIYVDSGSTDNSVQIARDLGAEVVTLDTDMPFTAARARNAGWGCLSGDGFVQFVDGDCIVDDAWIDTALGFATTHPNAVVICGRRRERFPDASVYNRLCDHEWNTPVGRTKACGGDALIRLPALRTVEGYREDLIAGEEPELCLRLIRAGGEVWRIDADMTRHDAAMTRFSQWWQRCRRGGYAFAEGAALHGREPERHWVLESRRAVLWGAILPLTALVCGLVHPFGFALLLAWPLQIMRLSFRMGTAAAFFNVLGKLPEAQGVLTYHWNRLSRRQATLIEYK